MPDKGPAHTRGPAVDDRVLDACIALLGERGYGFAVEEVAERAQVHKTTVYRRWPSKPHLVGAAMERLAAQEISLSRTDDPLADLEELLVMVGRALRSPAGRNALRAIAAASAEDEDVLPVARAFLSGRYGIALDLIREAVAAGRLSDVQDPTLIWEAMVNPLHLRSILGEPFEDTTARNLFALVLEGCRSPASGC